MGAAGNYGTQSEKRKKPRRQFQYQARVLISENAAPRACAIADISDIGARIVLESGQALPDRVMLLLNARGDARRLCRVVWRSGSTVGVEFISRPS